MFPTYFIIINSNSTAYRRKTSKSPFQITSPVRTTKPKKPKKPKSDEYDDDEDTDIDMDLNDNKDDVDWFNDLKMDPEFADDQNVFLTTGTPIDLRTSYSFKGDRWIPSTESTMVMTAEPTSTTLMDLKVIGFNETWCTYINTAEARKLEGEAFVNAVKKLCSENHTDDNDVRLALRHTLEVSFENALNVPFIRTQI